tara:strand:+ start:5267 stop:7036 length:1770 start_codon:yes stop_codon:yes gene_type:complete
MNKKNQSLKEIFETAVKYYKKKDFKTAEIYCYKIYSINPNHLDTLLMLATVEALKANFEKAKEFLIKAIEIKPNNVTALHNLATAYKELGKFDEAIDNYNKVLKLSPKHTNAHYNLGMTFYKSNQLKKAKSFFKKTVDIQNNFAVAFFWLANCHAELKEYNDAISCYQKSLEINPNLVIAYNNLGLVFNSINDFDNAISSFKSAVKIKPNHAGAYHNLALTFKNLGKFDDAIRSHEMAIKHEPESLTNYYYLSELKEEILDSKLKSKIIKIVERDKANTNNIFGNYLLAKYERKLKNYEQELKYLIIGHQNYFNLMRKKFELGVKYCFDDVLKISEGAKVKKNNSIKYNKIKPIFIVGVPRCGSTLIEKIIGSGKKLISLGEETAVFENYVNKKILEKQSLDIGNVDEVRDELHDIYLQKGLLSKKNDYIFTDKSLNNFFYLELIKDIYPDSKIIHCKRDVLSSIVSIFQNNLTELAWTHNLDNVFKYFDNYFEIIENFKTAYPNTMYELEFEKLTTNPLEESKKLMKFCDLPWDKKCLEFYKRKDLSSKTASNIQIREAIYKHSLSKYLPYKKLLDKYGKSYSWFNRK